MKKSQRAIKIKLKSIIDLDVRNGQSQKRHLKPILMIISALLPVEIPATRLRTKNEKERDQNDGRREKKESEVVEMSKIDGQYLYYYSWRI